MKRLNQCWYLAMCLSVMLMAFGCATTTYEIGGTVSGLDGTVVLQNNETNNLSLSANGNFTFLDEIDSGSVYDVTVLTQPTGQTCTVGKGNGIANSDITNVTVTCSAITYSIGLTVSGLIGTVVLQNNDANDLSITADGDYVFSTQVALGSTYDVTVSTQPTDQICTVTDGQGTANADVTNVDVACETSVFSISGSVSGLEGTLVMQNNAADDLTITSNGDFTFDTQIGSDGAYLVTVLTQPSGQTCIVTNESGTTTADVTNVDVSCANNKIIFVTAIPRDGSLAGISGADAICTADANKPETGTYKALIVGTARIACTTADCSGGTTEHEDWVLAESTPYVRSDGVTFIGKTNSVGIFSFPLSSSVNELEYTTWTGLNTDWTTSENTCTDWISNSADVSGSVGHTYVATTGAIDINNATCDDTAYLYCVEQ